MRLPVILKHLPIQLFLFNVSIGRIDSYMSGKPLCERHTGLSNGASDFETCARLDEQHPRQISRPTSKDLLDLQISLSATPPPLYLLRSGAVFDSFGSVKEYGNNSSSPADPRCIGLYLNWFFLSTRLFRSGINLQ